MAMSKSEVKDLLKKALEESKENIKDCVKEALEEIKPVNPVKKYIIYKKSAAFQFQLGFGKRGGAVFLEAASAKAERLYDWENKIVFALSPKDIGMLLVGFKQGKAKIFHDPGAQTESQGNIVKTLFLQSASPGTWFLTLTEKQGEAEKQFKVSVTSDEARVLSELLAYSLPQLLGWG